MVQKLKIHHSSFIVRKSRGFTLIELLIVVAIISILATLLMANFIGVMQRSRDGQRKSDLRQIQSALELYRSDQGDYPLTASFPSCGSPLTGGSPSVTYMQKVPCDPTNSGDFVYSYSSDGTTYTLVACLENVNDSQKDSSDNTNFCNTKDSSNNRTDWSYTLQNP